MGMTSIWPLAYAVDNNEDRTPWPILESAKNGHKSFGKNGKCTLTQANNAQKGKNQQKK
jgi:hypothetical protein